MAKVKEEWRPIDKTGDYEVSNLGRIRSNVHPGGSRRKTPLIRKLTQNRRGYVRMRLKGENVAVHRLVLLAFVGPPPKRHYQAAHKDGIRDNNYLSNLAWKTPKQNAADKKLHGTHRTVGRHTGSSNVSAVLTENKIRIIRKLFAENKISPIDLADLLSVDPKTIRDVVYNRTWKHVA